MSRRLTVPKRKPPPPPRWRTWEERDAWLFPRATACTRQTLEARRLEAHHLGVRRMRQERRDRIAAERRKREHRKTAAFIALCVLIVIGFMKAPDSNQVRSWLGKEPVPASVPGRVLSP